MLQAWKNFRTKLLAKLRRDKSSPVPWTPHNYSNSHLAFVNQRTGKRKTVYDRVKFVRPRHMPLNLNMFKNNRGYWLARFNHAPISGPCPSMAGAIRKWEAMQNV